MASNEKAKDFLINWDDISSKHSVLEMCASDDQERVHKVKVYR